MSIRILVSLVLRLHWALAGSAAETRIDQLTLPTATFETEAPAVALVEIGRSG